MSNNKEIHASKSLSYSENCNVYSVRLKKRRKFWWLLLLLLPLLLLIRCERSLTVRCYDVDTEENIEGAQVMLKYNVHYLVDETGLLPRYEYTEEAVTDEAGLAEFDNIKCSLFCYLFHHRSPMDLSAVTECYVPADTIMSLHCHRRVDLPMKQQTGLPVCVVDKDTYDGLPEAVVRWKLGKDRTGSIRVDDDGYGVLLDVPRCHGTLAQIDASAEGYYDTTYYNISFDNLGDSCLTIKMRPKVENYHVDIVMCIDNTGSMGALISLVRDNALRFHSDLKNACLKKRKKIDEIRLRVISFGDLAEKPIDESGLLQIPSQSNEFRNYVNGIVASGGGDGPEDGLEALSLALGTDWVSDMTRCRHIIIVYTDAPAHDLGYNRSSRYYPAEPIPKDFEELSLCWTNMDRRTSRLILFAPKTSYWHQMDEEWPNVYLKPLKEVLVGTTGYEQILEAISESL